MKSIVITGVSSGIGLECVKMFANAGYKVFGSVRKKEDAIKINKEIGPNFIPLIFDVTNSEAIKESVEITKKNIGNSGLSGLINNAGIAISGPLMHVPTDELQQQFDVNVFGLLNVTRSFLPLLGAKQNYPLTPGKIINISSVSGKIGYPFAGPYAASKHAVEAISHSLRRELLIYGIDVIIVGPGSVNTPIWGKAPVDDVNVKYGDSDWGKTINRFKEALNEQEKNYLSADFVAAKIFDIFHKKKPKTRYPLYRDKIQSWIIHNLLTDRMLDKIILRKFFK
ncbi:MAG: SDR family oxidoreductase [Calditrichaeota bacterium]|nr:MAG: SDR family NAD(P)-dependent oxidoreductase [Calditrichota bacterium]MBL1203819.1 SDR family oxidoreductase [Calditrichota bacterium]NOG43649.1 SDR family oxidoreductase [Calditrichota bacterium]